MDIKNKRILLTGADGGIGSVLAKQLAEQGAKLILCSTGKGTLTRLGEKLSESGNANDHHMIAADLGSDEDRQRIVSECEALGGIDILINLAGVLDFQLYDDQNPENIAKTININLLAPMLLCHALLPFLKQKNEAMILNLGSVFGSIGHPGFVAYCASKAGVKSFTEALARELADTSIRVSYIAPRATATALNTDRVNALNIALGNKTDSPDFVASKIIGQIKGGRKRLYLGWPEKLFVRINALLPSVVDKALLKNLELIKKYARS